MKKFLCFRIKNFLICFSGPGNNHRKPCPVPVQRDPTVDRPEESFQRLPVGGQPRALAGRAPQLEEHAAPLDGTYQKYAAHSGLVKTLENL